MSVNEGLAAAAPLSHLRVLDLSRVLAGPWATQLLGDLGAEVLKIERPGEGDDTRGWGPPFLPDAEGRPSGDAAYFAAANRNKRSLAIAFDDPRGAKLIRRLAAQCDVVVENFKVGGLAKYGLDWDSLRAVNPRLVYCSITGFGQTGPYAGRSGYDFLIQGMGGLMSVTGLPDDAPGGGPMKVGVAIVDLFTGMYATVAILAALARRDRDGEGTHIDLALLDVQVATLANQAMNYLVSGRPPGRLGNAHPNIVPYEAFRTADGHLILAVGNDGQFARFCAVAGRPDLVDDPRFRHNADRVANRGALIGTLAEIMVGRTSHDWLAALEAAGVPCGPINTLDQVFADPQVRARGMVSEMVSAQGGKLALVANPIRFPTADKRADLPPPRLGQHTAEALRAILAMEETEITELQAAGVIAAAP